MREKDDVLGLNLSLSLGVNQNQMQKKNPQQSVPIINHNRSSLTDLFRLLPDRSSGMRSLVRGFDVNSAAADCNDDNGDSSPNSTVSSASGGKRSERDEDNGAPASSSQGSDDDDGGGGGMGRKKLRLTKEQAMVLEETFKENNTLNPKRKQALAEELNLRPRQVEVWFQNRRARTKLKQTEVDCEYLKRCCENLTEENRRLQKEVQELRALKLSPQLYKHMNPPTTLTMCPSCERVAVVSSASSSAAAVPVNHWPFNGSIHRP